MGERSICRVLQGTVGGGGRGRVLVGGGGGEIKDLHIHKLYTQCLEKIRMID